LPGPGGGDEDRDRGDDDGRLGAVSGTSSGFVCTATFELQAAGDKEDVVASGDDSEGTELSLSSTARWLRFDKLEEAAEARRFDCNDVSSLSSGGGDEEDRDGTAILARLTGHN
jgi:hypothetical protein